MKDKEKIGIVRTLIGDTGRKLKDVEIHYVLTMCEYHQIMMAVKILKGQDTIYNEEIRALLMGLKMQQEEILKLLEKPVEPPTPNKESPYFIDKGYNELRTKLYYYDGNRINNYDKNGNLYYGDFFIKDKEDRFIGLTLSGTKGERIIGKDKPEYLLIKDFKTINAARD